MDESFSTGGSSATPPQEFTWYLRMQGEVVEVQRLLNYSKRRMTSPRGLVRDFSRKSRMRMLKTVAAIDWERFGRSIFVTLTYPDEVGESEYDKMTTHKYLFLRYLEKHLHRQVPALWRVEWKPRLSGERTGKMAPHFHLLIGPVNFVAHRLLRSWWRTIVHVNGPLCTDVQRVEAVEGRALYVAKYEAKNPSLDYVPYLNNLHMQGRAWGLRRKNLCPWAYVSPLRVLNDVQAHEIRTLAAQTLDNYDEDLGGGFTLLGADVRAKVEAKCENWA